MTKVQKAAEKWAVDYWDEDAEIPTRDLMRACGASGFLTGARYVMEMCRNRTEEIWEDGETEMEKVLYVNLSDIEALFEEEGK